MSDTLVIPLRLARSKGAHRRPFPLTTVVIWGGTSLVCSGLLAAGVLAVLAPHSGCHVVPMHSGWPNSHCHLTWVKWRQP